MPNVSFNGFRYSIKELYLLGEDMNAVPLNQIGIMRNLRTVGLSAITMAQGQITEDQFQEFAPGLEELKLVSRYTHVYNESVCLLVNFRNKYPPCTLIFM